MLKKTLKQVTLFFLVAVATLSCENSDDQMDTSGDLLGDWKLISYTTNGSTAATVQDVTTTSNFTGNASNINYIIAFSENPNKATVENGSFDIELMSSVNGMTSTETTTINDINSDAGWSRNGNTITFTEDFASFNTNANIADIDLASDPKYIIEELTNTSLILSTNVSEQIKDSGIDFDVNISIRLVLTRI